jgi:subtilisin-like proprotein convertase family protein
MDKTFTTLLSLLLFFNVHAQQFNGTGGPITNNGIPTYFPLAVSGLPAQLNAGFGVETVCININHNALNQLYIFLISPSGIKVELSDGASCPGANYIGTCYNSSQTNSITLATAPYTGTFKPMGYFGRFQNGQNPNGTWKLYVKDFLSDTVAGTVIDWSITFGAAPRPPVDFTSSNLPIIIINTNNQEITDADLTADMGIIDNGANRNYLTDARNAYNGKINIHLRGHTSHSFEKKSFSVETRDVFGNNLDVSLFGMPPDNDWVLNAEYADKTLMRNRLTYYMARAMGSYAPRTRSVEVVINGEYYGVYTFVEKPKRNDFRINIAKLEVFENAYPSITGGYIFKIDRTDEAGWYSYNAGNATVNHFYYQYVYPKDTAITTWQKNYIKAVMDSFEIVLNQPDFGNTTTGYPHFIEPNSFVDYLIVTEISKNVDGYRTSTYLTKDRISRGGKIKAGPVWDYDLGWHNANYGAADTTVGWEYEQNADDLPYPTWWTRLRTDDGFNNRLQCRWHTFREDALKTENLVAWIDATTNELNEAQQRNFVQWPVLGAYIKPNPQNQSGATWQGEITDLKNWIYGRMPWLDSQIPMPTACDTALPPEPPIDLVTEVEAFPNPFMDKLYLAYTLKNDANVKLELTNMLGDELALLFTKDKTAGIYGDIIEVPPVAAGIYVLKLTVGGQVINQKMVKAGD